MSALLLFAAFPEIVLGTHSFFYRDFGLFTYPLAHYAHESFWRGEIPLWNPLNNCGVPFLAQWNTTICYPLAGIYILFPLPWSLNFFCLGHVVLAAVAMRALAFRWTPNRFAASVAGMAYAFSGLMFSALMWTSTLPALAWLPLVLLFGARAGCEGGRQIVFAALVGALQMLASSPEIIALTWVMLAVLLLRLGLTRTIPPGVLIFRLVAVIVLVVGLSAVQLLPFLELVQHSQRNGGLVGAGSWAMPAWGWMNLFVPLFRCSPSILGVYSQDEQQWISSYYFGITTLALAVLAIRAARRQPLVWWLAVLALSGIVLAQGDNGFVYGALKRILPGIGLARYPIKFITLTAVALPLLAAVAVDWILSLPAKDFPVVRCGVGLTGITFLSGTFLVVLVAVIFPRPGEPWRVVGENAAGRGLFLVLTLAAIGLVVKTMAERRRVWIGFGILILLGLDVLTHAPRQNPTVTNRAYGPMVGAMSQPPQFGESRAMIGPPMQALLGNVSTPNALDDYTGRRRALYDDCNLLEHIPKVNGFYPLYVRENDEVLARLYTRTNPAAGLMDFLGVAQLSAADEMFQWQARSNFCPLITGGQRPVFADAQRTLAALAAPGFDPRAEVYLPPEAQAFVHATNAARVKISGQKLSAQKIEAAVEAAAPALVVVAQSFYPCWRAYLDGQPAKLLRANHAFQAVEVPAGAHELKLVYEDRRFYLGAAISLLTLAGCLIGCCWPRAATSRSIS